MCFGAFTAPLQSVFPLLLMDAAAAVVATAAKVVQKRGKTTLCVVAAPAHHSTMWPSVACFIIICVGIAIRASHLHNFVVLRFATNKLRDTFNTF